MDRSFWFALCDQETIRRIVRHVQVGQSVIRVSQMHRFSGLVVRPQWVPVAGGPRSGESREFSKSNLSSPTVRIPEELTNSIRVKLGLRCLLAWSPQGVGGGKLIKSERGVSHFARLRFLHQVSVGREQE